MKKMIVTLVLLLVVVLSVVSCSCGTEEVTTTAADNTAVSTPDTIENSTNREPIYDTDGGWGPLVPLQPIS